MSGAVAAAFQRLPSRCQQSCTQLKAVFAEATHEKMGTLQGKWLVLFVVEWLYYTKRIIIFKGADLSECFQLIFVCKMSVFVSRPMKIVTFPLENGDLPKLVVDFPRKETHSETKSWKSLRILTKKVTTTVNHGNRRGFCV